MQARVGGNNLAQELVQRQKPKMPKENEEASKDFHKKHEISKGNKATLMGFHKHT